MLEPTIKTAKTDLRSLLRDAQDLFREATSTTGTKAEELRSKGLNLLDSAVEKAQDAQSAAVDRSRELAESANGLVRENPLTAIAVGAGVGLLLGMLIARRY